MRARKAASRAANSCGEKYGGVLWNQPAVSAAAAAENPNLAPVVHIRSYFKPETRRKSKQSTRFGEIVVHNS
jgi:hypothetical protein